MGECKKALVESEGDHEKAIEWLQKRSAATASKKAGRTTAEGRIDCYIHHDGRTGVIMELNCETDFVAKTPDFAAFTKDLCMQVAAMSPEYVSPDRIPAAQIEKQREIFEAQVREMGKPEHLVPRIAEGKLKAWYADISLTEQIFVKDEQNRKISEVIAAKIAKIGENIVIRRFVRFEVGEGMAKKEDDFVNEVARMASA
jgi:elongation factor Ts